MVVLQIQQQVLQVQQKAPHQAVNGKPPAANGKALAVAKQIPLTLPQPLALRLVWPATQVIQQLTLPVI